MANIPVTREKWEALSDDDRQAIENVLRQAGALGQGDTIEPLEPSQRMQRFPAPKLNPDPVCLEGCEDTYTILVEDCTELPHPGARAVCYGAAMVVYAGCLALC